jgi:hypothetical protein
MKFQSTATYLFLSFSIVSSYGCAAIQGFSAGQEWSENYALIEGAQANDPAVIDGNVRTIGQSQQVEISADVVQSHHASSESVVLLPEPKSIHRVVVRSSNLEAFDIWVTDNQGRWDRVKEIKNTKNQVSDVRLGRAVHTAGVKIRIRRTSDDAQQRHKNVRRVRQFRVYTGNVRALAQIAEIELYGFVSKDDKANTLSQKERDEKELDELLEF